MRKITVRQLIRTYGLKRHPEGGYYKESYRAAGLIKAAAPTTALAGDRNFSTAIYFLLPRGAKSLLHRIKSDEIWHFYLGAPLTIAQLFPDGTFKYTVLGDNIRSRQLQQYVVPAGCWFGAYPAVGGAFSFVGCTVAPGFDFSDFELARRGRLLKQFPQAAALIKKLTV